MQEDKQAVYQSTSMIDGVRAPFWQAFIPAIATAFLAGSVVALAWAWGLKIPKPGLMTITAFICAGIGSFLIMWRARRDHWMWVIERAWNLDINNDGVIGNPRGVPLKIHMTQGNTGVFDELPFADRLPLLARAVRNGRPLTYSAWVGSQPGQYTQTEWGTLMAALLEQEYLKYNNPRFPNRGYQWTEKGEQLLNALIDEGSRVEVDAHEEIKTARAYAWDASPTAPLWHTNVRFPPENE